MNLFQSIKEKRLYARQEEIKQEAAGAITLSDYGGRIYIAHNDIPLIPISDSATPAEIIQQLNTIRSNYVNAKCSYL